MTKRKSDSLTDGWRVRPASELFEEPKEPYFISHLLSPERKHDCYFLYGTRPGNTFGAVKQMLLAHSAYFRGCLHEDKTNEPEFISAGDLTQPTLKNILRYVYGHDNISTLSFDEANRLLFAADKFLMVSLRDNVAIHLASKMSYENICILLNNPVCSELLSLRSSINKILQNETEKVLASPSFVDINVDAFVSILTQETLKVPEIELWRAALAWAKKQAGTNEGRALRTRLTYPLKYIRLCSLSPVDLCKEVVPTQVLTDAEVRLVTTSVGLGEKQTELISICNEIQCRRNPDQTVTVSHPFEAIFPGFISKSRIKVTSLIIITKDHCLELLPFEFTAKQRPNLVDSETYECSCAIQVINELTESTDYVGFDQPIKYGESFNVPIKSKGKNVRLLPNSEYTVRINFTQPIWFYASSFSIRYSNQHFEARFTRQKEGFFISPIKKLSYKCVSI